MVSELARPNQASQSHNSVESDPNTTGSEPPSHKFHNYRHPTEAQHRTAEEFSWRHSFILNCGIAAAAVLTVIFAAGSFCETRRQANIAQNTLVDTNRAWIDVSIDPSTLSLTWKGNVPTVRADVTGKNVGNSPALDVQVFLLPYVFQSRPPKSDYATTKELCAGYDLLGNLVFMNDITTVNSSSSMPANDADRWMHDIAKFADPKTPTVMPVEMAVCASYKIIGDEHRHHTALLYDVGRPGGLNGSPLAPFIGQDIPAGSVAFMRLFDGEYAD